MLNCRDVNRRFHQDAVLTTTRKIFETTSSDRHHSSDQSKKIDQSEHLDARLREYVER
jgi:hypothetical protein